MPGTIKDLIEAGQQIHGAQLQQRAEARRVSDHIAANRGDQQHQAQQHDQGQAAAQ